MCGHVGVAGKLETKDETLAKKLLMYDFFRGPDSTGLAAIGIDGKAKIAKQAASPPELFHDSRFKAALNGNMSRAFIGHNRYATRGEVNAFNAHPYQFGHITGAHNGTLETRDKWALEDAVEEKFDVDSQALFKAIEVLGIEATISMLHSSDIALASSAWALVWHNKTDDTMNFLHNQHRPLWYGFEKGFKKIMWSSTWEILDNAVRVEPCIYDMYVEEETRYKYWPFDVDVHYSIKLDSLKDGGTQPPIFNMQPLKGKEPVAAIVTSSNPNPFGFRPTVVTPTKTNGSTTTSHGKQRSDTSTKARPTSFVHLMGDIGSPYAGWMDEDGFNAMAKYGCSWCAEPVTYGEPGVTIYLTQDMVICPGCSGYILNDNDVPPSRIYVRGSQIDALMN